MPEVITSPDQITPQWLTTVLALDRGEVTSVEKTISHPHGDIPFSTVICRLTLDYSEGAASSVPKKLFLKIASPALMIGIPGLGKREVYFYNSVSGHADHLPSVRCYQAVYSDEQDRYHVLLDDLTDTHFALPPMQMPPLGHHCDMIIDALAHLHAHYWNHPQLGELGTFIDEDEIDGFTVAAREQYQGFTDFLADRLPDHRRAIYEMAINGLPALMRRRLLDRRDMTIVFEDVHAGNFLYPRDPAQHTLKMIDWEQWCVNIGTHDLARMMGIFWFPERRARLETKLLHRYFDQLTANGVEGYSWDDLWFDYRFSIAQNLFVPVWQWSRNRPPDIWWNHLERITSAFDDLKCQELFE